MPETVTFGGVPVQGEKDYFEGHIRSVLPTCHRL
jgi:hypothetical protein